MEYYQIIFDSCIGFLILIVTAIIAGYMNKQNKIQQQIERPILVVDYEIVDRIDTWNEGFSRIKLQLEKKPEHLYYDVLFSIKNIGRTPALNGEIKIINNKTGKVLEPIGNYSFKHEYSIIPPNDQYELSYPIEYLLEPQYLLEQLSDGIKDLLQKDNWNHPDMPKLLAIQELFRLKIIGIKSKYQDNLGNTYSE